MESTPRPPLYRGAKQKPPYSLNWTLRAPHPQRQSLHISGRLWLRHSHSLPLWSSWSLSALAGHYPHEGWPCKSPHSHLRKKRDTHSKKLKHRNITHPQQFQDLILRPHRGSAQRRGDWANSGRQWRTGKPGVLRSTGLQSRTRLRLNNSKMCYHVTQQAHS